MYWIVLAGFAIAGAYLLVYYLPSLKFRQANFRGDPAEQQAVYGAGTLQSQGVTSGTESHLGNIYRGTSDIMQVIKSAHGAAPRIVISRN